MELRVFPENLSSIGPEIDFLKSNKVLEKINWMHCINFEHVTPSPEKQSLCKAVLNSDKCYTFSLALALPKPEQEPVWVKINCVDRKLTPERRGRPISVKDNQQRFTNNWSKVQDRRNHRFVPNYTPNLTPNLTIIPLPKPNPNPKTKTFPESGEFINQIFADWFSTSCRVPTNTISGSVEALICSML